MATPSHDLPRAPLVLRWLGTLLLRLQGWRIEGGFPEGMRKCVLIANPHTSNWDFWFALLGGWAHGVVFQWLGKDSLFRGTLGPLLSFLGGVAVDRSKPNGLVEQVGERFAENERLLLMVPASGTRSYRDYWKSGFYWMAKEAQVPIVLGYLDYGRKVAGIGIPVTPTDDLSADMDRIRAFYEGKQGKYPDQVSRIRLRAEDGDEADGGGSAAGS